MGVVLLPVAIGWRENTETVFCIWPLGSRFIAHKYLHAFRNKTSVCFFLKKQVPVFKQKTRLMLARQTLLPFSNLFYLIEMNLNN